MIHPLAWLGWLASIMAALSMTRNPLYLVLIFLCIALANESAPWGVHIYLVPYAPLRLTATFVICSMVFNALSVHYGDTVLGWLPRWLPLFGGAITLEALVFGALNGLMLAELFFAFAVAQRSITTSMLIGLIPRAFYSLAVVASIAISFIPTTLRHAQQIREAQAIRGHRLRRLRDWLPLLMPLLIGGLERAFQLAEAMTARGFAAQSAQDNGPIESTRPAHRDTNWLLARIGYAAQTFTHDRLAIVLALTSLLVGWLLILAWGKDGIGTLLILSGAGLLFGTLWRIGRRSPRTRYRRLPWSGADTAVLIGTCITLAALLLPVAHINRASLTYYPYPRVQWPLFDPLLGFALLGLTWPAIVLRVKQ